MSPARAPTASHLPRWEESKPPLSAEPAVPSPAGAGFKVQPAPLGLKFSELQSSRPRFRRAGLEKLGWAGGGWEPREATRR